VLTAAVERKSLIGGTGRLCGTAGAAPPALALHLEILAMSGGGLRLRPRPGLALGFS